MKSAVGMNKELRKSEVKLMDLWRENCMDGLEEANPLDLDLCEHVISESALVSISEMASRVRTLRWALGMHKKRINEPPK